MAHAASVWIAQTTDDDDSVAEDGGRVKVDRQENLFWMSIHLNSVFGPKDDDIVVNTRIRVIRVLVFASDVHNSSVRQLACCPSYPIESPDRYILTIEWHLEKIAGATRTVPGLELAFSHVKSKTNKPTFFVRRWVFFPPYHPLPKGKSHMLRVGITKPRASLLIEQFPANLHDAFSIGLSAPGKLGAARELLKLRVSAFRASRRYRRRAFALHQWKIRRD
jgi:hypothetical protein